MEGTFGLGQQSMDYAVDIVFCIDNSGSMSPIINEVLNMALGFDAALKTAMEENDNSVSQVRVKVIRFTDMNQHVSDRDICESPFWALPQEAPAFRKWVSDITVYGGGEGERGLEALAMAMKSDWTKEGWKRRHVIVLFTDEPAHDLDGGRGLIGYPSGMPKSLAALQTWWESGVPGGNMEYLSQRIVLFAPDVPPWNLIKKWDAVQYEPCTSEGLKNVTGKHVIDSLVKSMNANRTIQ